MSTYFLSIIEHNDNTAFAFGDLDEISYIAKRRVKDLVGKTHQVSVSLLELKRAALLGELADDDYTTVPDDNVKRQVTVFSGDADTAAVVLKRRLAAERAESNPSATPASEQETQVV